MDMSQMVYCGKGEWSDAPCECHDATTNESNRPNPGFFVSDVTIPYAPNPKCCSEKSVLCPKCAKLAIQKFANHQTHDEWTDFTALNEAIDEWDDDDPRFDAVLNELEDRAAEDSEEADESEDEDFDLEDEEALYDDEDDDEFETNAAPAEQLLPTCNAIDWSAWSSERHQKLDLNRHDYLQLLPMPNPRRVPTFNTARLLGLVNNEEPPTELLIPPQYAY